MALPVKLGVLRGLIRELQVSARDERPLVVGGARELAAVLRRELGVPAGSAGGQAAGTRLENPAASGGGRGDDDPDGAAVYVHVVGSDDDEATLKRARRARVPIVAVDPRGADSIPYVPATDVVHVRPGEGFPIDEIARAVARRLGEEAAPLAARVPALRRAVGEQLVASFARKNGLVGAAVFVPGADLPVLALNQVRLVLRLEQAHGLQVDPRERAPEILAALGAGLGLRALARELLDLVPCAGWLVKGTVAYAGTRALGEATVRRLEPGGHGSLRRPRAGAAPAAP